MEVHWEGKICRKMHDESERDDGKAQTGDVQGRCGLKGKTEGGARRISEASQKPIAAERVEALHLYQP